ncbi:alpha/beta hydrolase [Reinekea sp.]|uniref:alpha/beta hydrolase n=1 Tax=Reinekea sp. TaxID=1970455 RepID=UPI002A80D26A|nr:alpha/beta hydrolase [Reinekea sp.]
MQNVRPIDLSVAAAYQAKPVFFVTDRNDSGATNLNKRFGHQRAEVQYGLSRVAIPKGYPKAHEAAFVHWNLALKRNPAKYIALLDIELLDDARFFAQFNNQLLASPTKDALVFIHGYNVTFERATRISAKLAYDLDLAGPTLSYSWPSAARVSHYAVDEANLSWSIPHLTALLQRLFADTDVQRLYLVAHSLGTQALSAALIDALDEYPEHRRRIGGIVLAAPDMDAEVFRRDIAPQLTAHQLPITLYVSSKDLALNASRTLHGHPRAGQAGATLVVVDGIDTVDASNAEAELFGHEYFSQGAQTITDMSQWLRFAVPPARRPGLIAVSHPYGTYWRMVELTPDALKGLAAQ